MPRQPRLDFPNALHHVIARGIERRAIFRADRDREDLLAMLGGLVADSGTGLYAWCLMPNHFHLLLRTGSIPLSRLMQRLLGNYADLFNPRYHRSGHLFQNRFKSTLVEEEPYFLEVLRYIHLNPVRSRLPVTIEQLDHYRWTGHAVLLGKRRYQAQDVDFVLQQFGRRVGHARQQYRLFLRERSGHGKQPDLAGGGLRRSLGAWHLLERLPRGRQRWACDERILGSSDFVRRVLSDPEPSVSSMSTHDRQARFELVLKTVARTLEITEPELRSGSARRSIVRARSLLSYLAVRHLGCTLSATAHALAVSPAAISRALEPGEKFLNQKNWKPADFLVI